MLLGQSNRPGGDSGELASLPWFPEPPADARPTRQGTVTSKPSVLLRKKVTSPKPSSESTKAAATWPPARSNARFSLCRSFSFRP